MVYSARSVDKPFFFGADSEIKARARALRKHMTSGEDKLWQELRRKRIQHLYFRRQHPVSQFIVDFYCHGLKLVIEVDGSVHDTEEQKSRDIDRTAELEGLGLLVLRFSNNEIINNISGVLDRFKDVIKKRLDIQGNQHSL